MYLKSRWTTEEDEFLRKHYRASSIEELKQVLNRSESAIKSRAASLKLSKKLYIEEKDGMYKCTRCDHFKTPENYYVCAGKRQTYCKICFNVKRKEKIYQRKLQEELEAKKTFIKKFEGKLIMCTGCREDFPISEYAIYRGKGKTSIWDRRSNCHTCHKRKCMQGEYKKLRRNDYANKPAKVK